MTTRFAIIMVLICMVCWFQMTLEYVAAADEDTPVETVGDIPRYGRKVLFETQKYRDEGNWEESARQLREVLEKYSNQDHFLLRFYLAVSLEQAGQTEEAIEQYQTTVGMEPRYVQAWLNLAELAYNEGLMEIAGEAFYNGFQNDDSVPPRSRLLYYAATCFMAAADDARAVDILEELVTSQRSEPELDWFRALILACINLEDWERGQQHIANMLRDFPDESDAWFLAFQFAASHDDYRQAAIALTVVSYLRPLTKTESMTLGDIYTAIGVPAQASIHYESALNEGGDAREFERLASSYLAAHQSADALRTLERALAAEPSVRLWSLLGDQHYMNENYAESYEAYLKVAELDPDYGRAYLMMGYCALELNRITEALTLLEKATGYPGQEATALNLLRRAQSRVQAESPQ